MSLRTVFLSKLIGLYCILATLAVATHRQATVDMVTALVHDPPLLAVVGVLALIAGLAMVLVHNVWSGGALSVVVTVIGWLVLIRGLFLLLVPPDAAVSVFAGLHYAQLFHVYMAVSFILGLYLTYGGFRSTPR